MYLSELLYVGGVAFVKASICVALMRLSHQKRYRIPLWILIGLTCLTNAVNMFVSIFACQPISGNWDPEPDSTCSNPGNAVLIAIFIQFSIYISVDIACAVIPIFLVRRLQMKRRAKISTAAILGLGLL